jgi:hypothetical protein
MGSRDTARLIRDLGARRGEGGQHHVPPTLPPAKTWYPLYTRLGWRQGRSRRVRKISPPPGFNPRTVQPTASMSVNEQYYTCSAQQAY